MQGTPQLQMAVPQGANVMVPLMEAAAAVADKHHAHAPQDDCAAKEGHAVMSRRLRSSREGRQGESSASGAMTDENGGARIEG